jgi:hypothetical protein
MPLDFDLRDRAAAYLAGEFSAEEATDFEREMAANTGLREEVEACRRALEQVSLWMRTEAPGEELSNLLPPPVAGWGLPHSSWRWRQWWGQPSPTLRLALQGLAACVIFVMGFTLGSSTTAPSQLEQAPLQLTAQPPVATPLPTAATEAAKETAPRVRKSDPPRTQVVDEGGRLVIETTLAGSTARAVWVVDGNFNLE